MGKRITTLTDEEKEEAKDQVRAIMKEAPLMEMLETETSRPNERTVRTEWSRETGKWRITRCMEFWKD